MSEPVVLRREGAVLRLGGALRMAGIVRALEGARRELAQGPIAALDLAEVSACDSSAVALVLELRRAGVTEVRNIPADMLAIIRACQLEPLLATDLSPAVSAGSANHNEHP